jgi:hypothetical protein
MLGNHGHFRLEGTYLHKATSEAAAKENNAGFGYGEPAKPGEWRPWDSRKASVRRAGPRGYPFKHAVSPHSERHRWPPHEAA